MKKLFTVLTILAAALLTAADYYQLPKVKLIHDGWGLQYQGLAQGAKPDRKYVMTTQYIKDNVELLEKSFPGSGIIIRFTTDAAKCEGTPVNISAIFGGKKIKYEYFKDDIENLKNTKFKKLTDNFIGLTVSPGNVDWFDDTAWDIVCNNHKVIARVAKDSGMVGLKFDIEEYHKNTMWQFNPQKGKTLAETHAKIRQRGQEFGKALFSEFPDMEMLCYWWISLTRHKNDRNRPAEAEYMVAPFINGVYDVLPPTVKIHDGDESCAYRANDEAEFYHLAIDVKKYFLRFIDPKNVAKYRAQTFIAPGIYVDPHFAPKFNFWGNQLLPDLEKIGGAQLLKRNLINAMEVADKYVWMWHERSVWFPSHHPANPIPIASVAPKVAAELDLIASQNQLADAKKIIAKDKINNIIYNSTFDKLPEKGQKIPGFGEWHGAKNQGAFARKAVNGNAVVSAKDVVNGCIYQSRNVKPGQVYLARCTAWNITPGSKAKASFTINYKRNLTRQGKPFNDRFADYLNKKHFFQRQGNTQATAEFVVTVPEHAESLELMLSVTDGIGQEIYFDNVELYKLMD